MKLSNLISVVVLLTTELVFAGATITSPTPGTVYPVTVNQNFSVTCNVTPNVAGTTINRVNFYYWRDGAGVPLCTPNYPTSNPTECSVTGTGPTYTISNAKITAVPSNAGNDVVQCMGVVVNGVNVGLPVGQELYVNVTAGTGTAPTMPATISATANSSSQITVNWSDSSNNETGFEIQRATNAAFTANMATISPTIAPNTTSKPITGLTASTTYFFRVRSINSAGSSAWKSMTTGVATQAAPVTAPTMPATISATANSSSQITVNWSDSSNNETSFTLQRARNSSFTTELTTLSSTLAAGTTSYQSSGLLASTIYFYRVRANNSSGSSAYKAMTTGVTTLAAATTPAAPSGLSGSASSSSQINLTFTDNASNESTFTLERATNSGFTSGLTTVSSSIASISGTGASGLHADSPVTASTTYYYRVKAVNAAGSSAYSTSSAITTPAAQTVTTFSSNNATKVSVTLSASVSANSITLKWGNISGVSHNTATIYRKPKTSSSWTQIGTTAGSNNQYVDSTVAVGTYYEYKVQIPNSAGVTAYGYVASGIQVPVVENRGKLILMIHSSASSLSGMSSRLTTLRNDLKSEGWTLVEPAVPSSVTAMKAAIVSAYNADPTNVKAVFIIGHAPVARSGLNFGPDGHGNNNGAWPADGYYTDMNGSWTDSGSNGATDPGLHNVAGDEKFDQSNFPSSLELQIGRVDLQWMDEFSANYGIEHDPVLYNAYFDRLHNYKAKVNAPQNRAFIQDNFTDYNFAASGFKNFSSLVGSANVTSRTGGSPTMFSTVNNQSYLFAYGCGGGSALSSSGISNTGELANGNWGGVFNFAFGSYFGQWMGNNNFLRALISGGAGLTNMWVGATQGYFHHMAMGDTIGYSAQQTMNNKISQTYYPETGGNGTGVGSYDNVELSLMGDPTLRLGVIAPPSNLAVNVSGNLLFSWTAAPGETGASYLVYQVGANGGLTRVTPNPITTTSYQSTINNSVQNKNYIVKTYKLITSQSGSYYNTSIGSNVVTR
jgi:hypothetical protein